MIEPTPHTRTVLEYVETLQRLVPGASAPEAWTPLVTLVAVDEFERVGTFCEVQSWDQYLEMLTQWASTIDRFETTIRRIGHVDETVYLEVEERHLRGGDVHIVNSMTVFGFDDEGRIRHVDVYLQQPR